MVTKTHLLILGSLLVLGCGPTSVGTDGGGNGSTDAPLPDGPSGPDVDNDGDGYTENQGDCNDNNASVHPNALELCDDNIDNNCNGIIDTDCPTPCELAAINRSSVGCVYYAVDTNPLQSGAYAIAVSNVDDAMPASVVVEVKTGGIWAQVAGGSFSVPPLGLQSLTLPHRHIAGSALYDGGAYRITSDLPVVAYQFNPVNGASSYLSDASLLLPRSSLDTFYIVPGWPLGPDISNIQRPIHLQIAASATTEVRITSSIATAAGGGVPALSPGVQTAITINEGDFIQLTAVTPGDSFNGSAVESDQPILVFVSNDCANVPLGAANCCCDHLEEQIFGLQTWGTSYVAARGPQRIAEPAVWQIMAQQDNTNVTFDANGQVTGLPGPTTLNARQSLQITVGGPTANPGDFVVNADKPILVTQYMVGAYTVQSGGTDGDPSMVQAVPTGQYLMRYVVLVPTTWVNDFLVLVRSIGATVDVDGSPVSTGWIRVGTSNYEAARLPVADGVHVITGSMPVGVLVVGYDQYDSYAYPGGLDQQIINPVE